MNPRFQIFVSSTFRDLRKERQAVLDAILELGHFPAGMEVFPAADSTPWSVIETIIAESDYYILIIGGTYGSTDKDGISYTEHEYDYAVSKGIPVLAFLHRDPSQIPAGMSELNPDTRIKLTTFRNKVESHHCKYWLTADELKSQVVVGVVHAIRTKPRIGWIRSDQIDSADTLKKLTVALEENAALTSELKSLRESFAIRSPHTTDLAGGADTTDISFQSSPHKEWAFKISWDDLLQLIGPDLLSDISESSLHTSISKTLVKVATHVHGYKSVNEADDSIAEINDHDFLKIVYQFLALDYIEPITLVTTQEIFERTMTFRNKGYRLTKLGAQTLGRLKAIKKNG